MQISLDQAMQMPDAAIFAQKLKSVLIVEHNFLQDEKYELLLKSKDGRIKSVVFPDFKIPIQAIFDERINLQTLKDLI